jgi:hypothetical protein
LRGLSAIEHLTVPDEGNGRLEPVRDSPPPTRGPMGQPFDISCVEKPTAIVTNLLTRNASTTDIGIHCLTLDAEAFRRLLCRNPVTSVWYRTFHANLPVKIIVSGPSDSIL